VSQEFEALGLEEAFDDVMLLLRTGSSTEGILVYYDANLSCMRCDREEVSILHRKAGPVMR
jgi:hypothetical protein